MRLLLVLDSSWGQFSGTERYAQAVVGALARAGVETSVLCARRSDLAPPAGSPGGVPDGVPVETFEPLAAPRLAPAERARLRALLRSLDPEVVYLQTSIGSGALEHLLEAAPVARFVHEQSLLCPGGVKLHATGAPCREPAGAPCLERRLLGEGCVGFGPAEAPRPFAALRERLREIEASKRCAALLAGSRHMRRELLAAGFAPERAHVLPLFASERPPDAAPPALSPRLADLAEPGPPIVLATARLTLPAKGVDLLLRALARTSVPRRAVVCGAGPDEGALRALARELGLGATVRFTGWVEQPELDALLDRASVVAFPSHWDEPFGLVGLEAMQHGKPVVAFDVGGVREWLDEGATGLLAPRGDVGAFARALDELFADPARAAAMGAAGAERAARAFTLERHVDALLPRLRAAL